MNDRLIIFLKIETFFSFRARLFTLSKVSANVIRVFSMHDTNASLSGYFVAVCFKSCPIFMNLSGSEPSR